MRLKLKTSKSALKRFKISSRGKIKRRSVAINHFNAKDSGGQRRRRREEKSLAKADQRDIRDLLPYLILM